MLQVFFDVVNQAEWDHTWAPTIAEHVREFGQRDRCVARLRDPSVGHLSFETW